MPVGGLPTSSLLASVLLLRLLRTCHAAARPPSTTAATAASCVTILPSPRPPQPLLLLLLAAPQHCRCYSCAHKLGVGWTGPTGKYKCDVIFRNNLNAACDFNYGTFNPNRGLCRATAAAMYTAVSLADQSYFTSDVCPGESIKLANTNYCFNPLYQLPNAAVKIKSNNGQIWGSWTSFAQVGGWW